MQIELPTSFSDKVASLVTGITAGFLCVWDFGYLYVLPSNLFPEEYGLIALDRLFPLKPKNPI